jgi:hypothetical protein
MKESEFFEILSIKTPKNPCKINNDFEFEIFYQIQNVLEEGKFLKKQISKNYFLKKNCMVID